MGKWIAAFIVLALIIGGIFWLSPSSTSIHQQLTFAVNTSGFAREISNEQKWTQWWPAQKHNAHEPFCFEYNGNCYTLAEKKLSSLLIQIKKDKDSTLTELVFIPVAFDSIELSWNGVDKKTLHNTPRIKKLNSDLGFLLEKIRSFYSDEDPLYGFAIREELVPDSNLISTSATSSYYPSTKLIYSLIDRVKNYIQKNGAKELGYPMLNINKDRDSAYLTRVAVPVDKKLKDSGDIHYRWMLKGGNILVTEVKGGPYQIDRAFDAMGKYVEDHRRTAPAIPFQSLITDRRQEPDTSKWVTKIYWPVM